MPNLLIKLPRMFPRGNYYTIEVQLLCYLRYLATGSFMEVTSDLLPLKNKVQAHRSIHKVMRLVAGMAPSVIKFPIDIDEVSVQFQAKYGFPGVIGCIDGTHIPIQRPSIENAEIFRCRKGFMSINVQGVCGPDLKFYNIVARWPGSSHDSRIYNNSYLKHQFEDISDQYHLLGDSAYPLSEKLLTPYRNPLNAIEISDFKSLILINIFKNKFVFIIRIQ